MAKSSNKKKTATKVGKGKAGKAGKAVSNKIEIVEQNEEDGGDEMVIDIEMVDEEDGGDTSGTSDDADEDMEDASNDSMSASSEDANGADSNSKKTSGSTGNSGIPIPFLDTFYALSAENANERAAAAHCLIRHCFQVMMPRCRPRMPPTPSAVSFRDFAVAVLVLGRDMLVPSQAS